MPSYQVTCITRDQADPDWRIDAVGFADNVHLIDDVIEWLNSDENKLWVVANGKSVWVGVRQHPQSRRLFLATHPDGYPLNNLAELPECP